MCPGPFIHKSHTLPVPVTHRSTRRGSLHFDDTDGLRSTPTQTVYPRHSRRVCLSSVCMCGTTDMCRVFVKHVTPETCSGLR